MKREYKIRSDGYGHTALVREQYVRRGRELLGSLEWSQWVDIVGAQNVSLYEAQAACDAHEARKVAIETPVTYTHYTPKVSP